MPPKINNFIKYKNGFKKISYYFYLVVHRAIQNSFFTKMNLSAQVPLLSTSKIEVDLSNNPQANKKSIESDNEVFFFMPNSPSQRSLMDIQLPDSPTFARVLLMAFFPCFVAPICSPEKKQEFWRVPRTVTFLMCLIQVCIYCFSLFLVITIKKKTLVFIMVFILDYYVLYCFRIRWF